MKIDFVDDVLLLGQLQIVDRDISMFEASRFTIIKPW